mmetsp:Transcript_9901/g.7444  ORF Transcript_9901/g.7444 Transcript_9901/m.7444 type:complete len:84 (+) Transcript_9901:187-438(+)|eukprot:CAMPEP_0202967480 /NCGR_PEP_ID=MMETSP1396-20130829/12322_1 /ASSEMBLY_ACC=CAM_ASM_000872 /TAXON_ID= /ORGANISM="Pseudokeronopsis sp., Strain Brazil" /LENGTH=83 /DNA_ID=CAMNT_0049692527 /DNA_START=1127 /DNA_END=1378 /DNA_ORIENTATION=+
MVDRRMINKFLIEYLKHFNDAAVKSQMLESMSKVLVFSMEEKESLGLVKKEQLEGGGSGKHSGVLNKGISDKFINFLLDDEDE